MSKNIEKMEFQTEVKKMLDIVIHSLYTDVEIFLRELISNGTDAMEKARYMQVSGDAELAGPPLEIHISTDEEKNTLTIEDAGIGMSKEELIENLGTIAHSGAKTFIEKLGESDSKDVNLIGQFGVGFYSAFMVADSVELFTKSITGMPGVYWKSEGAGTYEIAEDDSVERGTKILLHLKSSCAEFAKPDRLKDIIKQYSSFVSFPVLVEGERVNTVDALWLKNKKEITEEEYQEFYKFVGGDYQEPLITYHFSVDAPLAIHSILYVPKENMELRGFGQLDPGVRLYSKRVMIQEVNDSLLPKWLRFLKGVVDSPEIPLNISRETMQDSMLMKKIGKVLTGRFLKYLSDLSKKDPDTYLEFYKKFGVYLKEGLASDSDNKEKLIKLLRFESSKEESGKLISVDDYLARQEENENKADEIYYMSGASREVIEKSPYLEIFAKKDQEVLYTFDGLDDYVLSMSGEYKGKHFVSAETADLSYEDEHKGLDEEQAKELAEWFKETLGDKVSDVKASKRLLDSPVLVKSSMGMSSNLEKWLTMMDANPGTMPRVLEFNPHHPLLMSLYEHRDEKEKSVLLAKQLFDNAMLAAGLPVDFPELVARINRLMEESFQ
ncbi:molecular chaperone HtpG [Clostridia bacterium]|nr:molecular chaperone HtpG [Clostridia bacterium]